MASPLLDKLPAELRNRIYATVLISDSTIEVEQDSILAKTSILRTCKQTRREAAGIFYSENKFSITLALGEKNRQLDWLATIGCKHADLLAALSVDFTSSALSRSMTPKLHEQFQVMNAGTKSTVSAILWPVLEEVNGFGRLMMVAGVRVDRVVIAKRDLDGDVRSNEYTFHVAGAGLERSLRRWSTAIQDSRGLARAA